MIILSHGKRENIRIGRKNTVFNIGNKNKGAHLSEPNDSCYSPVCEQKKKKKLQ